MESNGDFLQALSDRDKRFEDFTRTVADTFKEVKESFQRDISNVASSITILGNDIKDSQRIAAEAQARQIERSKTPAGFYITLTIGILGAIYGGVQLLTSHEESYLRPIISDVAELKADVKGRAAQSDVTELKNQAKTFVPREEVALALTTAEKDRLEIKADLKEMTPTPLFQAEIRRLEEESKMRNETLKEKVTDIAADLREIRANLVSRPEVDTRFDFNRQRLDLISNRLTDLVKRDEQKENARADQLDARSDSILRDQIKTLQTEVENLRALLGNRDLARTTAEELKMPKP